MTLDSQLSAIWADYSARTQDLSTAWREGAVYLRESRREQADGFSPAAQLKGTLDEATKRELGYHERTCSSTS